MTNKIADGDRLQKILKERKIKQIQLSEMTGIHPVTISRAVKSIHLNTEDIKTICESLGMEIWEFFIDKKDLADKCKVSSEMLEIAQTIEKFPPEIQRSIIKSITTHIDGLSLMANHLKRR